MIMWYQILLLMMMMMMSEPALLLFLLLPLNLLHHHPWHRRIGEYLPNPLPPIYNTRVKFASIILLINSRRKHYHICSSLLLNYSLPLPSFKDFPRPRWFVKKRFVALGACIQSFPHSAFSSFPVVRSGRFTARLRINASFGVVWSTIGRAVGYGFLPCH